MNVKTLKDFDKELLKKINHELEIERKTNEDLARILRVGESQLWDNITMGTYGWLQLTNERKERLFKLIKKYKEFYNLVETVEGLHKKIEKIKQLKDGHGGGN